MKKLSFKEILNLDSDYLFSYTKELYQISFNRKYDKEFISVVPNSGEVVHYRGTMIADGDCLFFYK